MWCSSGSRLAVLAPRRFRSPASRWAYPHRRAFGTVRSEAELAVLMAEATGGRVRVRSYSTWESMTTPGRGGGDHGETVRGAVTGACSGVRAGGIRHDRRRRVRAAGVGAHCPAHEQGRLAASAGRLGVVHGSLRTMFRSQARAQERGYRDTVASAFFAHASTSGGVSLEPI